MPQCPQCNKDLPSMSKQCPFCKADLDLLVDYVNHLGNGVARAEEFTREGELDKAVWAYLEVLEVDPDNAVARKQVGKIATAVRHFDSVSPTRRWLASAGAKASALFRWLRIGLIVVAVVVAFGGGFFVGYLVNEATSEGGPKDGGKIEKKDESMMKKRG